MSERPCYMARRIECENLCGYLTDEVLICAFDCDLVFSTTVTVIPAGISTNMGVTYQVQGQNVALKCATETNLQA